MGNRGAIVTLFLFSAVSLFAQLSIDKPVGGEIFYTNRTNFIEVNWSGVDDTTFVQLEWSTDGRVWHLIADSLSGLTYQWDVTKLSISSSYRVRVSQVRPPTGADNAIYTGHNAAVVSADWGPGGDRVVSVAAEPHVWDAAVGGSIPLRLLPGPRIGYASVDWSSDSSLIAAGGDDGTVRVYETAGNTLTASLNHQFGVTTVAIGELDNLILTESDDDRARIFRLPNSIAERTFNPAAKIENVYYSPDGSRVLVCANDARIYPVGGGLPLIYAKHGAGVLAGAWSPDGSAVCTIGGDATIRLWDAVTAVERWTSLDSLEGVRCVSFSHDGLRVAVGMSDSTVTIWNVVDGSLVQKIGGHSNAIRMVRFSPDDSRIASASDDNTARVYEFDSAQVTVFPHQNDVTLAKWSPDGTRLLTASRDGTAIVWRVRVITLQADTSGIFSLAAPPPAFATFIASGDTINIGEETTIGIRLEGATGLDLADIDSVQFTMDYDATMLHLIQTSVPVLRSSDSAGMRQVTLAAVPMPLASAPLLDVRFRGTLGADSLSAFRFRMVEQIGSGPGVQVTTRSEPILVRGICREGGTPRLYDPIGTILQIVERISGGDVHIDVTLAESGPTSVQLYDLMGNALSIQQATADEERQRFLTRVFRREVIGAYAVLVITTSTQTLSKIVGMGGMR